MRRETYFNLGQIFLVQVLLVAVYLVTLRLIRLHLETRRQLAAAERHAEVGRFAGTLAHEIKNPLSSLGGLIGFAARKEIDPELQEVLQRSGQEVTRLNALVDDFLSYGKETVLEISGVELLPLIERARELVGYDMAAKGLTCRLSGESFPVEADRDRLLQVLVNLLLNAAQAAPAGSTIDLHLDPALRRLELINPVQEPFTGDPARLFEPFFSTRAKGSGLGLAISRKILELHRFEIAIPAVDPFTVRVDFGNS